MKFRKVLGIGSGESVNGERGLGSRDYRPGAGQIQDRGCFTYPVRSRITRPALAAPQRGTPRGTTWASARRRFQLVIIPHRPARTTTPAAARYRYSWKPQP